MKLTYVTRVNVPGRAAQSLQIEHMARAFHAELTDDFRLIASRPKGLVAARNFPLEWLVATNRPSRPLNYFRFLVAGLRAARYGPVFTRDIAIAFAIVVTGGQVLYEMHRQPETGTARRLTRWLAGKRNIGFVSISQALADFYIAEYGLSDRQVHVAHDGAFVEDSSLPDPVERKAILRELGLPQDKIILLHSGSVYKGGAELFGHLAAPFGERALLVHVGGKDEQLALWRRKYADCGNVELRSQVSSEIARKYQLAADYLLYINTRNNPIYWCTSPLKLFEYMATGLPIIGADIGSVGEVLNDSNAFCFDPDDLGSIRRAIEKAMQDPEEAQRRATRARQQIEEEYSWYRRARGILEFAERMKAK